MRFFFRTPFIPFLLVPLLIGQPAWTQVPAALPSDEAGGSSDLQLRVISSESPRVPAGSRSAKGFIIQVTNASGAGVPEAAVAVRLPDSGSSGTFPDGSHSAVVYTDNAGSAHIDSIQWGETPGTAVVRITATKGSNHAGILMEQSLVASGAVNPAAAEAVNSIPPTSSPAPAVPAAPPAALMAARQPGVLSPAPSVSVTSIGSNNRSISPNPLSTAAEPSVSVVSSSQERFSSSGSSMKKWIILGVVIAAGAGAGFAFMNKNSNSSSTTAASSSISFGSPTVSVGHP